MHVKVSVLCAVAVMLAAFVSCGDDVLYSDNCVENTTDKEILMTDGNDIYTIPAGTTVTVSVGYDYDADVPELSVVNDGYPRVKTSVAYLGKRNRKYTIEISDYVEYTVINTGRTKSSRAKSL